MTIVAYRDGIICADSRCSASGAIIGTTRKLAARHGRLAGGTGPSRHVEAFLRWIDSDCPDEPPIFKEEFLAIVVQPDGQLQHWSEDGYFVPISAPFSAVGCADGIAIGAMARGASAREAVAIAIEWDGRCGGPIQEFRLDETVAARRRARGR